MLALAYSDLIIVASFLNFSTRAWISIIRVCILNFWMKLLESSKSCCWFSICVLLFVNWLLNHIFNTFLNKIKKLMSESVLSEEKRSFAENWRYFLSLLLPLAFKYYSYVCIEFFVNFTDEVIGSGERVRFFVRSFVRSSSVCEFHEKLNINLSIILKASKHFAK